MAHHTRRGGDRQTRRDQQVRREVRQEVGEEIRSTDSQPIIRRPNRDQARGAWDRTGDHQDIGASRALEDDESLDERK